MASEMSVIYNHPYIASNITNDDTIFESVSGQRPFFYTIISERGEDNVIKMISSVDEFLFKYGEPNISKFGQANYNVLNLLQNGETVYILRAMPSNAGFSHAMFNVQSKIQGNKYVKNVNGEKVLMDNIILRPTVTYSRANNTNKELLDYEMTKNNESTIDGYRNNVLFYVLPVGRGKYYDKYGFRISLNSSYDETYNFRVYNFEVIEFDEYDNASVIEGPFYVSLYPDALTNSNESMFIEDVVNRYSSYLKVYFNTEAYDYLTNLINPDVDPAHIDIISGVTREVAGEVETFFNPETQKQDDVHIRILKYDSSGEVLTDGVNPIPNIVNSSDDIEASVISIDNSVRNSEYSRNKTTLENMKQAISDIYNGLYENSIRVVGTTEVIETEDPTDPDTPPVTPTDPDTGDNGSETGGTTPTEPGTDLEGSGDESSDIEGLSLGRSSKEIRFTDGSRVKIENEEVVERWNEFKKSKEEFDTNKNETTFTSAYNDSIMVDTALNALLVSYRFLLDYSRVLINDTSSLSIVNNISTVQNIINTKEIAGVKIISYKNVFSDYMSEIIENKTIQNVGEESYALKLMLVEIDNVLDYYKSIASDASMESYNKIAERYNTCIDYIEQIDSEFMPDESKEEFLAKLYDEVEALLNESLIFSDELILENIYDAGRKLYEEDSSNYAITVLSQLAMVVHNAVTKYNTYKGNSILRQEMLQTAENVASIQSDLTVTSKSNVYTTILTAINQPIQFKYGNEGDLDESNPKLRNTTMDNLLIRGYKGLIDDGITSNKIIPARFILDANYSANVKDAMHQLATEIRDDIFFYCDTGFTASPEEALSKRTTVCNFNSRMIAIYTQDFTVYDSYLGKDIKVTTPYFLASKIPQCSTQYGLHRPIAGNKRGLLDGFKTLSWVPNEAYKELLYNKKINYIESDTKKTRFGSQLTSESRNTPLSNINNVITIIDIKNDVELMAEDYQFEFNNSDTINNFQNELTDYLATYTASQAAERIECKVYASDYDKLQKILRVTITVKFYDIIEKILINLDVVKK